MTTLKLLIYVVIWVLFSRDQKTYSFNKLNNYVSLFKRHNNIPVDIQLHLIHVFNLVVEPVIYCIVRNAYVKNLDDPGLSYTGD